MQITDIKSIRVGPYDSTVDWLTGPRIRELGITDGDSCMITMSIRINADQSPQLLLETLIHEIAHVVNFCANVTDNTTEEDSVQRTSPYWLQVFRDNPRLLVAINDYSLGEI